MIPLIANVPFPKPIYGRFPHPGSSLGTGLFNLLRKSSGISNGVLTLSSPAVVFDTTVFTLSAALAATLAIPNGLVSFFSEVCSGIACSISTLYAPLRTTSSLNSLCSRAR